MDYSYFEKRDNSTDRPVNTSTSLVVVYLYVELSTLTVTTEINGHVKTHLLGTQTRKQHFISVANDVLNTDFDMIVFNNEQLFDRLMQDYVGISNMFNALRHRIICLDLCTFLLNKKIKPNTVFQWQVASGYEGTKGHAVPDKFEYFRSTIDRTHMIEIVDTLVSLSGYLCIHKVLNTTTTQLIETLLIRHYYTVHKKLLFINPIQTSSHDSPDVSRHAAHVTYDTYHQPMLTVKRKDMTEEALEISGKEMKDLDETAYRVIFPDDHTKKRSGGLAVHTRKTGVVFSNAFTLDYRSAYPATIVDAGICFTYEKICPMLCKFLIEERIRATSDGVKVALKLAANCIYGYVYCMSPSFGNMVATLCRNNLRDLVFFIEGKGFAVIFGVTDSVIVISTRKDEEHADSKMRILKAVDEFNNTVFLNKMTKLVLQEEFIKFTPISNNAYAGMTAAGVKIKGSLTARLECCPYISDFLHSLMTLIFKQPTKYEEYSKFITMTIRDLFTSFLRNRNDKRLINNMTFFNTFNIGGGNKSSKMMIEEDILATNRYIAFSGFLLPCIYVFNHTCKRIAHPSALNGEEADTNCLDVNEYFTRMVPSFMDRILAHAGSQHNYRTAKQNALHKIAAFCVLNFKSIQPCVHCLSCNKCHGNKVLKIEEQKESETLICTCTEQIVT